MIVQRRGQTITYRVVTHRHGPEEDSHVLTAMTDRGARVQAARLARECGWGADYTIEFFRSTDGCRGEVAR
jgi:hypothetical protein